MREALNDWANANRPDDELAFTVNYWKQIVFVRDEIAGLIGTGLNYIQINNLPKVISTHKSKSIILPVYELERQDIKVKFILRNNFYNWKLSVISERPIESNLFQCLFYTTPPIEPEYTGNCLDPVYFEGFPKELIFGYYGNDKCKWSAEIIGNHILWTVIFLCMNSLGVIKPLEWHTKEEHLKELEEIKKDMEEFWNDTSL